MSVMRVMCVSCGRWWRPRFKCIYVHVDGFAAVWLWKQAVRHKTKEDKAGRSQSTWRRYPVIVSKKQKEPESTVSILIRIRRRARSLKGRFSVSRANGRNAKTIALCSPALLFLSAFFSFLFSFFFYSCSHLTKGESGVRGCVWGCRFLTFLFSVFFTCFSNARWKMPTKRVGVGVEHPFPWFWQLLAFVSAMEVVPGVLC